MPECYKALRYTRGSYVSLAAPMCVCGLHYAIGYRTEAIRGLLLVYADKKLAVRRGIYSSSNSEVHVLRCRCAALHKVHSLIFMEDLTWENVRALWAGKLSPLVDTGRPPTGTMGTKWVIPEKIVWTPDDGDPYE